MKLFYMSLFLAVCIFSNAGSQSKEADEDRTIGKRLINRKDTTVTGASDTDTLSYEANNSTTAISSEYILLNESPGKEVYKLKIHGSTIKFSDIPDDDASGKNIRYFELFALDEIIIDKDFIKNGKVVQVVAIAPKLKIIGSRTINLNGLDAKNHTTKAKNGRFGIPGNSGLAGLPGGPGGIFYALANDIENVDSLTILANGGSGGRGQDGGNGGKGYNGTSPDIDKLPEIVAFFNIWTNCEPPRKACNYTGTNGYPGGDGGHGGIGGKGGKGGVIFLHQLNKNSRKLSRQFVHDGQNGLHGKGGAGGHGGKNGGYMEVPCCGPKRIGFKPIPSVKIHWRSEFAPSGENGADGASTKNQEEPKQFLGFSEFSFVVNDYGTFLKSHWNDKSRKERLVDFYNKLSISPEINSRFKTLVQLDTLQGSKDEQLYLNEYINKELHGQRNYNDQIDKKIEEASSFVKSQIEVEIDKIEDELKDKVYQLINETMILRNMSLKRRNALQSEIYLRYLKTLVKMGVKGATVLIPGGHIITPAALTAVDICESFAKLMATKPSEIKIPKAVEKYYKEALESIKNNFLQPIPDKLNSASNSNNKEGIIKSNENTSIQRSKPNTRIFENIWDFASGIFNKPEKNNSINSRVSEEPMIFENVANFANDMFNSVKVLANPFNISLNTFYPDGDEKEKMKQIQDEINKVNDDVDNLKVYQDEIFLTLIPLLRKILSNLPTEDKLRSQSTAALDVSSFRVQIAIKKLGLIMEKFTDGFEVKDDVNRLVKRLNTSIDTLISIYDRIQSYQREKNLATYVTSAVVNSTLFLMKMQNLSKHQTKIQ